MKIVSETAEGLVIDVPVYRIDVQRDVDVIEDILRIYGYNNVEFSDNVKSNLSYQTPTDRSYKLQNLISEQLCGCGFNEILNNSLTRSAYYDNLSTYPVSHCVMLMNPLSADLNCMRQTLLFGGLESVEHNAKRKNSVSDALNSIKMAISASSNSEIAMITISTIRRKMKHWPNSRKIIVWACG